MEENKRQISYEELKFTAPIGLEPVRPKKPAGLGRVLLFFLIVMAGFLVFGSLLQYYLGMGGVVLTELLFLVASLLFVRTQKEDFRRVFPVRKPKLLALGGTAVLWLGSYLLIMVVTLIQAYFFPAVIYGESGAINTTVQSIPWGISFLIVAVVPAICEEAMHRGVIQYGVQNTLGKTWQIVLVMGIFFGCFHLSLWKFLPTAVMGAVMSYILLKTGNMVYSSFLHFLHNGLQMLLLLSVPGTVLQTEISLTAWEDYAPAVRLLPLSIGIYLCIAALVPYLFYLGNWMLKRAACGHKLPFFPKGKESVYFRRILILMAVLLAAGGTVLSAGVLGLIAVY